MFYLTGLSSYRIRLTDLNGLALKSVKGPLSDNYKLQPNSITSYCRESASIFIFNMFLRLTSRA